MRIITALIIIFIGQGSVAQVAPTSKFSSSYLPLILEMVQNDSVNYQIDTSYLQNTYENDIKGMNEDIAHFSNISNYDLFSLIKYSGTFLSTHMRDSVKNYSGNIINAVRYYYNDRKNYKYTQWGYGYDIIELAALCDLPSGLRDSLLKHEHLPLKVRARLGDQVALDSLIRDFKRSYRDTVYCKTPTVNYTEQLLYVNSKKSLDALLGLLSKNIYMYIRLDKPWMSVDSLPRWRIISSNTYILNEIVDYFKYDPCRFFDRYTYAPFYYLPQWDKPLERQTTRYAIKKPYMRFGTKIYTVLWKRYLEQKFKREINVDFNGLYVWLECQITPPPYLLKDLDYSKLVVNSLNPKLYGQPSSEQEQIEFENRYLKTIRYLEYFYKDIWFRDDCQN